MFRARAQEEIEHKADSGEDDAHDLAHAEAEGEVCFVGRVPEAEESDDEPVETVEDKQKAEDLTVVAAPRVPDVQDDEDDERADGGVELRGVDGR